MLTEIKAAMELFRQIIDITKQGASLLPDQQQKELIEAQIKDLEQRMQTANVAAAQEFGYELHRCTYPPQIMLEGKPKQWTCPKCGETRDTQQFCMTTRDLPR